jgi:uncharacterized protein (DUF4415 family)
MRAKKTAGSTEWIDPDDAPELTDAMMAEAEVFQGDRFVRRGPGRPKAAVTKEQINVRLDPDVLARLREGGPGWQSRINAILRGALGLGGRAAATSRPGRLDAPAKASYSSRIRSRAPRVGSRV